LAAHAAVFLIRGREMKRPFIALVLGSMIFLSGCADFLTSMAKWQDAGILNPPPIRVTKRDKQEDAQVALLTGTKPYPPSKYQTDAYVAAAKDMAGAKFDSETANRQYAAAVTDEKSARDKAAASGATDADRTAASVKYDALRQATEQKAMADARLLVATDEFNDAVASLDRTRNGTDVGAISPEGAFFTVQRQSSAAPQDSDKALQYLWTGITVSNFMCQRWFTELGADAVTLRQTSDALSATGSLVTVMAGALDSSPRSLAAAGGLFGIGKQSLDAITANYIFSPDLAAVQRSLNAYRTIYAKSLLALPGGYNFASATDALTTYDNTCSQLGVKTFVTQQVTKENNTPSVSEQLNKDALRSFATKYAKKFFSKGDLTADEIVPLYSLLYLSPTSEQATTAKKVLSPLLDNDQIGFIDGQSKDKFLAALQSEGILALVDVSARQYLASLANPGNGNPPATATSPTVTAPPPAQVPASTQTPSSQIQTKTVPPSQPIQ